MPEDWKPAFHYRLDVCYTTAAGARLRTKVLYRCAVEITDDQTGCLNLIAAALLNQDPLILVADAEVVAYQRVV